MKRKRNRNRRIHLSLMISLCASALLSTGCLDSDIAKRFREALRPDLVAGLSAALTDPFNAEIGLRQAGTAVFQAVGAVIQPRTTLSEENASNSSGSN